MVSQWKAPRPAVTQQLAGRRLPQGLSKPAVGNTQEAAGAESGSGISGSAEQVALLFADSGPADGWYQWRQWCQWQQC